MEKIMVTCEMEVTLKMIGGKCKPLILDCLIQKGTQRFSELMREITQVSQRTLTNQLRELEHDGLILRTVYAEVPPRVEYSITPKGKSLETILELMCQWGEKNIDERFVMTNPQCSDDEDGCV
ncbi:MAG: winged helix-turn-helix transcriptional regulator [Sakamotonia sp.]